MSQEFDLFNIIIGDTNWLDLAEIAFRTTFLFAYTLILMRFVGNRGVGQLSMAEFILIIALGSAVGDPMFYFDVPLIHGMVVIALIVIYQRLLTRMTMKSERVSRFVEGTANRLIIDGMIDLHGLKVARLTHPELFAELRQKDVYELGEIHRAYLELDGEVSVFKFDNASRRPGLSLLPQNVEQLPTYNIGDVVPGDRPYVCRFCGHVEHLHHGDTFPNCPRCDHEQWTRAAYPREVLVSAPQPE